MKPLLAVLALLLSLAICAHAQQSEMSSDTPKPESSGPEADAPKTYSIALRVRRVIYEDAYVSVPVTSAIMKQKEDGTPGIDFEKFVAEALRISKDQKVEWKVESSTTEPHPVQQPKPDDRKTLDGAQIEEKNEGEPGGPSNAG